MPRRAVHAHVLVACALLLGVARDRIADAAPARTETVFLHVTGMT